MIPGRVRVKLFNEDGSPVNPEIPTRAWQAARAAGGGRGWLALLAQAEACPVLLRTRHSHVPLRAQHNPQGERCW